MQNAYPISTPMEMRSLDPTKDMFKKRMETEQSWDQKNLTYQRYER